MAAPLIIAHRTVPPYAAENSIEGLHIAFDQGADGVEIDLRMSLDQRPFLMHDNFMRRTTGWPLPLELTPSFIVRTRSLKGGIECVPSLGQVLDALPQDKLLAADIKTPWAVLVLGREVAKRGIADRTLVWCSSGLAVRYATKRNPGWEVAHYKDFEDARDNRKFITKSRRLGARAVSLDWRSIDAALVAYAHALGLRVYSWHKDYDLTEAKLTSGLDGLITDHPVQARRALST
jgi:glycerophosphoryl diester phosphodiesterase